MTQVDLIEGSQGRFCSRTSVFGTKMIPDQAPQPIGSRPEAG
jgi:hypothetical protein